MVPSNMDCRHTFLIYINKVDGKRDERKESMVVIWDKREWVWLTNAVSIIVNYLDVFLAPLFTMLSVVWQINKVWLLNYAPIGSRVLSTSPVNK